MGADPQFWDDFCVDFPLICLPIVVVLPVHNNDSFPSDDSQAVQPPLVLFLVMLYHHDTNRVDYVFLSIVPNHSSKLLDSTPVIIVIYNHSALSTMLSQYYYLYPALFPKDNHLN